MKPCWLLVVAACSQERDEPRELPPPAPRAEARQSIDVTVTGAPVTIRGVELSLSSRARGVFELGYRVESAQAGVQVPAQIRCRVGGYNIAYPSGNEGKVAGRRLAALFKPDPFTDTASACEVRFFLDSKGPIAAACFAGGKLGDGTCPAETFPLPARTTTFDVELTRAALELRHGTALVSGLFTVFAQLADNRRFVTQIRCEDNAGIATGEGELAFLPLGDLERGDSLYGPVPMFLDRTLEPTATCELRIASRVIDGPPTEQIHARYCLTTGSIRAGSCE
ncbi:MAG TPA: hypothetical protein VIV11_30850 [Kofleriaceae bacterium]